MLNYFYLCFFYNKYKDRPNESGITALTPSFEEKDDCAWDECWKCMQYHQFPPNGYVLAWDQITLKGIFPIIDASKRCQYAIVKFLSAEDASAREIYSRPHLRPIQESSEETAICQPIFNGSLTIIIVGISLSLQSFIVWAENVVTCAPFKTHFTFDDRFH